MILDVLLGKFPRGRPRSLKDGVRVRVHHGSGNVAAHVALGSGKELAVADARRSRSCGWKAPAFVFAGDHFTVRDWSEQQTLAGGVLVLDPDAHTQEHFAARKRLSWLERAAESIEDPARLCRRLRRFITGAVRRSHLLLKSRFSNERPGHRRRPPRSGKARSWRWGTSSSTPSAGRTAGRKRRPRSSTPRIGRTPEQLGVPLAQDLLTQRASTDVLPLDELFDPLIATACANASSCAPDRCVRRASHRARARRNRCRRPGRRIWAQGADRQAARSALAQRNSRPTLASRNALLRFPDRDRRGD